MIHKLSKKTIHIMGVIAVFIFIVYLNFTCNSTVTREGLSQQESIEVNRHKMKLDDMKNTICLQKDYKQKVEQLKELNTKLEQMKRVNKANSEGNSAAAGVSG